MSTFKTRAFWLKTLILRPRSRVLAIIFATGLQFGFTESVRAADYSLPMIAAAVNEFARSIETLEGRQEVAFQDGSMDLGANANLVVKDSRIVTQFKIDLIHRRTFLLRSRTWYYPQISDDPIVIEGEVTSFDGKNGYTLICTLKRSPVTSKLPLGAPYRLHIGTNDQTTIEQSVWRLAGLSNVRPRVPLAEVLSSADARVTGQRILDGRQCVEIVATDGPGRVELSLDPQASWLPRRYLVFSSSSDTTPTFEQRTTEFARFSVGESGESVWFPVRGRETRMGSDIVEITLGDLRINAKMEASDFQVDPATLPDGVRVESLTGTTYTGDRKDLWEAMKKQMDADDETMGALIKESRAASSKLPGPPTRVDLRSGVLSASIVIGVVCLVVVLIWIRSARKHV